jgi:hypothetical protein
LLFSDIEYKSVQLEFLLPVSDGFFDKIVDYFQ